MYDIEVELSDSGKHFKDKIQAVTNIPPERQKILVKGGKVADDVTIESLNIPEGKPVMVLGTPDKGLPSKPVEKQVFLEDLNELLLYKVDNEPSGLVNLGNTCYLNSSLQVMFLITDLKEKLDTFAASSGANSASTLTVALKSLFGQMKKKQQNVNPTIFLTLLRSSFPQFAERSDHGFYKQQDAEEAYLQILSTLNSTLKVEDLFRISFKVKSKCLALPDEVQSTSFEDSSKLSCHITISTNFLRDGILSGLKEKIEKFNDTLQSNAEYELSRTITRLPKYLTVQFVRFYWKRDTQKKSKILRKVQFPFELDLSEMLDEDIKLEKVKVRDEIRRVEKDNLELIRDFKKAKTVASNSLAALVNNEEEELKLLSIKSKFQDDLKAALPGLNLETTTENPSSVYQLQAIISHKGASADSGHYQAFVKDPTDIDGDKWWKYNDDKVSVIEKEKIEQLAGGGESDNALILLYKGIGLWN